MYAKSRKAAVSLDMDFRRLTNERTTHTHVEMSCCTATVKAITKIDYGRCYGHF